MISKKFNAMGCSNQIQIYDESKTPNEIDHILEQAILMIQTMEQKYSRYRSDSILNQINNSAGKKKVSIDQETAQILNYANTCYQQSDGLFDITSGVLRKIWNFNKKTVPNQQDIKNILKLIGWNKISWDGLTLFLPHKGMELDFGGIVKEFTADQVSSFLQTQNVESYLVNLGGDIKTGFSHKPKQWNIAIQHPRHQNQALGYLNLTHGGLATSGDYERFFIRNNQRYCHIFNPKTGYPIEDGKHLQSVSIIADYCVVAGSLSTLAMLLPEQNALNFLNQLELKFIAVNSQSQMITNAL